jgi:uncharacterized delta-60 repeat protein
MQKLEHKGVRIFGAILPILLIALLPSAANAQLWTTDPGFAIGSAANNAVNCIIIQPDSKILVSGSFTQFNAQPYNRIVRLLPSGQPDPTFQIGNGANGDIRSMALQPDGKILIGGVFSSYNSTSTGRFIRLNSNGSRDLTFNAGNSGANNEVLAIAVQADGKILIGGIFSQYNATPRSGFARLNANGSLDTAFNSGGSGPQFGPDAIVVQPDGRILIGGTFNSYNGTAVNRLTRLLPNGSIDTTFQMPGPVIGGFQVIVPAPGGKFYLAGNFYQIGIQSINRLTRIDSTGALDPGFSVGTGASSNVRAAWLRANGQLIIAGDFAYYSGSAKPRLAQVNNDGSLDYNFNPCVGSNGTIRALALQSDGKLLLGGNFTTYNGFTSGRFIRLEPSTSPGASQPLITTPTPLVCPGSNVKLYRSGGSLNGGDQWVWYSGGCGQLSAGTGDSLSVLVTADTTWFWLRGEGPCISAGPCDSIMIVRADTTAPLALLSPLPLITATCDTSLTAPQGHDYCDGLLTATTSDPIIYDSVGTYTLTWVYTDQAGNSSTQSQTVHILPVDVSLSSVSASEYCANNVNASYQWLSCGAGAFNVIPQATSRCFVNNLLSVPPLSQFAVVIQQKGCIDTSACVTILSTGVEDAWLEPIQPFPNPAGDRICINLPSEGRLSVWDPQGHILILNPQTEATSCVDISVLCSGLYLLKVSGQAGDRWFKFFKE